MDYEDREDEERNKIYMTRLKKVKTSKILTLVESVGNLIEKLEENGHLNRELWSVLEEVKEKHDYVWNKVIDL